MMTWRISRLWMALLLALAAAAALPAGALADPATETPAPARQILVMLKVAPPHFRPGNSYGGTYGDTSSLVMRKRTAQSIARKNGFTLVDGWPMPLLGVDCYVMRVADGESIDAAIARVSRDSRVAWSEPMQLYQAMGSGLAGADPLYPIEPAVQKWRLSDLHKVATGRGVSVAVIDSQVEVNHPDLEGKFIADKNFLSGGIAGSERHGTAVAGIIGATGDNGIGIEGIAPDAQLMALRACWQTGGKSSNGATLCESLGLARALQYAIDHKAKVINLSLSGPPGPLLTKLISIALARNTTVVAAFDPSLPNGGFPASLPGVIAVADQSLQNMPANVYGAPGRDIPTTQPGGKWYLVNGTSYSVAHVSGLIALVRQRGAGPAMPLVRRASGAIDACATLLRTSRACDCDCRLAQNDRGARH
jgi:hypothetical protein